MEVAYKLATSHEAEAQQIDELVTRNRVYPGRQRLGGIVGMPLIVHRQQRLLHDIRRTCLHA